MSTGACPTRHDPFWIATASYTATCPDQNIPWGWMPAGPNPISGAVVLRSVPTLDILAVHDYHANGAIRFSRLIFEDGVLVENNAVRWVGGPEPVGLEALDRFNDELFAAVTSNGTIFMVKMNWNQMAITDVSNGPISDYVPGTEIEAFATMRFPDLVLAIWATRGGPSDPAVISWGTVGESGGTSDVAGTVEFTTSFPAANQRHIAALRVAQNGDVYATSTSDPGDDGPFSSAAYKIGKLSRVGDNASFALDPVPTELYRSFSHKAEGIAGLPGDDFDLGLILASDDENFGGSIYLQYAPIGRHLTVTRSARSCVSLLDAQRRAFIFARNEAIGELKCFAKDTECAAPFCAGDYYSPEVCRTALSTVSAAVAKQQAKAEAREEAQEWCDTGFDQQSPPVVDGVPTDELVEVFVDELGPRLIDELVSPFQNE